MCADIGMDKGSRYIYKDRPIPDNQADLQLGSDMSQEMFADILIQGKILKSH